MRNVQVIYRQEQDGAWIATCPEIPGYVGHGDSYDKTRDRVLEGLPWFAEEEQMLIAHVIQRESSPTGGLRVSLDITAPPKLRQRYFGRVERGDPAEQTSSAASS